MKKAMSVMLGIILTVSILSLVGCGGTKDQFFGDWAYNHDTENTIISFKTSNNAVYEGQKYKYTFDDTFITLTSKDNEIKLRYQMDQDEMILYQPELYVYVGDETPDGLIGSWMNENNWSFEFTTDGTFRENDYFPGYYFLNEDGSVKLVYNDHFPDATLYYTIDGTQLTVEYPWTMVKTGTVLGNQ